MCMCGKPTINGQPGYSWDGKTFSTRPVNPPKLAESDALLIDEPGRCGGIDAHSHHFRVVRGSYGYSLLVAHGGGEERICLGVTADRSVHSWLALGSDARFWLLHTIYSVHRDATDRARELANSRWRVAAAEKRIKTRKLRGRGSVKVWIEDAPTATSGETEHDRDA